MKVTLFCFLFILLTNSAVGQIMLNDDQKSYILGRLSQSVAKLGLKFNTDDKDRVLVVFETIVNRELTPATIEDVLKRYEKRVNLIDTYENKENIVRFLRKIAEELQDKDIDFKTFDKLAAENNVGVAPNGYDATLNIAYRKSFTSKMKPGRILETIKQEYETNDKSEDISLIGKDDLPVRVGDDLWFSLLISNEN